MRPRTRAALALATTLLLNAACRTHEEDTAAPLATIAVTAPANDVEAGAPVDLSYRFERTAGGAALPENYVVFVHVLDEHGRLLWTDDHQPPVATSTWGTAPVEYRRTMFVPRDSAAGPIRVEAGLYAPATGTRVPLTGVARGNRAYEVASLVVRPPGNAVVVMFGDGWHNAEQAEGDPWTWRWSRGAARLSIRNPRRNIVISADLDTPAAQEGARTVEWRIGDEPVATTSLTPGRQVYRIAVPAERLGTGDQVDFDLRISPTFVPSSIPALASQDRRELGVRLFNVHVGLE